MRRVQGNIPSGRVVEWIVSRMLDETISGGSPIGRTININNLKENHGSEQS